MPAGRIGTGRAAASRPGERKLDAAWHKAHPMPKNPTLDQRIEWHLAHARACGCRAIEGKLLAEMRQRGIAVPVFGEATANPSPSRRAQAALRPSRRR